MDSKSLRTIQGGLFCLFIIAVLFMTVSCKTGNTSREDLEHKLQEAYRKLYMAHYAADFSSEKDAIDYCYAHNDRGCIKTFNYYMDGKQYILEQIKVDPQLVLEITLDTIFKYFKLMLPDDAIRKTPDEGFFESTTCIGAIIALYFFHQDDQDRIIFDRFKNAPVELVKMIMNYEWQYNRPDPERWVKFVESLPEKQFPVPYKEDIIETLKLGSKKPGFKPFGLMLDRAGYGR